MIRQLVPENVCLACRGCCRFSQPESVWSPGLLQEDIDELMRNNIPPLFILANYKLRVAYDKREESFLCSLLDADKNKCKVYAFRPFECQLYPFLVNRRGQEVFLAVDLKCPFVRENRDKPVFKEYVHYLTDLFNNPDLLKSLRNNPQIIQAYDEVQDIAKLKI